MAVFGLRAGKANQLPLGEGTKMMADLYWLETKKGADGATRN